MTDVAQKSGGMIRLLRLTAYKIGGLRAKWENLRSRKTVRKITGFCYSPMFLYVVGLVTLVFNLIGIDELTYSLLAVAAAVALVFCPDILPAFAVYAFFAVGRSVGNRDGEKFAAASYAVMAVAAAVVGVCAAFHLIMNFSFKGLRGSRFNAGMIVLSAGLVTNGFFFNGYTVCNFTSALKLIVYMVGVYFLLRTCVRPTRDTLRYFAFMCVVHGLVVGAELCATYFINEPFIGSGYQKRFLELGWGISNTVGATLFRDMPFCFYLMCTEKKHNWYYFAAACCIVVAQVFSYARASLLFTVPLFVVCYVFCCIFGKNRLQTILCGAIVAAAGIACVAVLWQRLYGLLKFLIDTGFNDRGRFELWAEGVEFFKKHPVFGVGLMHRYRELFHNYTYYHNTLIQYTVTGGVVGIATYLFFRMQTYALFTQKLTRDRFFLGVLACGLLLISLLDNFVMYLTPQMYLNFAIVFAERDLNRTLPFAYRMNRRKGLARLY